MNTIVKTLPSKHKAICIHIHNIISQKLSYNHIYVIVVTWASVVCLICIYTRSLRVAGLRAEAVHIRQTTSAHATTFMYHFFSKLAGSG